MRKIAKAVDGAATAAAAHAAIPMASRIAQTTSPASGSARFFLYAQENKKRQ